MNVFFDDFYIFNLPRPASRPAPPHHWLLLDHWGAEIPPAGDQKAAQGVLRPRLWCSCRLDSLIANRYYLCLHGCNIWYLQDWARWSATPICALLLEIGCSKASWQHCCMRQVSICRFIHWPLIKHLFEGFNPEQSWLWSRHIWGEWEWQVQSLRWPVQQPGEVQSV